MRSRTSFLPVQIQSSLDLMGPVPPSRSPWLQTKVQIFLLNNNRRSAPSHSTACFASASLPLCLSSLSHHNALRADSPCDTVLGLTHSPLSLQVDPSDQSMPKLFGCTCYLGCNAVLVSLAIQYSIQAGSHFQPLRGAERNQRPCIYIG